MIPSRRLALLVCAGLACAGRAAGSRSGPRLSVSWTGSDTASFAAPATAEQCDAQHLLEIRAIAGDTGVGLALYDSAGFAAGEYPIRPGGKADSTRPGAALGVRWFSATAVQGFQGDSGRLTLRRAGDGALSGDFTAWAHALTSTGHLTLTGSFQGLRVRPAVRGCAPPPALPPPAADSSAGVD